MRNRNCRVCQKPPLRSIEDEGCSHFERRMLVNYGLDEVKLRRLGYFFLVHSHIDTKLIALVVKSETVKPRRAARRREAARSGARLHEQLDLDDR